MNQQLGEEPPRAPTAREAALGTISGGGVAPPNPPVFFVGDFLEGPFWVDLGHCMCRIRQLLNDYVSVWEAITTI